VKRTGSPSRERPDYVLVASAALVVAAGLAAVYSASSAMDEESLFTRQILSTVLGAGVFVLGMRISLRLLDELAPILFAATCLLLVVTIFAGTGPAGRWLIVGPFRIQPSEIAKVAIILLAARWLSTIRTGSGKYSEGVLLLVLATAVVLTWLQPDLGTAVSMCIIVLGMFYWAGYGLSWIFLLLSPLLAAISSIHIVYWVIFTSMLCAALVRRHASPRMWAGFLAGNTVIAALTPWAWNLLRPYQQARLTTFLNPGADPHGAGWNVIQSEVAVGSGGLFGQGFLHGAQKQLAFLPARHTDFIFPVWAEEFGFVGALLLLSAFFVIIWRVVAAGRKSLNPFNSLVAAGTAVYFSIHVILNVGMSVGVMPVTGLPLLLVSFGGNHLLMALFLLGLAVNSGSSWRIY
jgi:rod shape determining protein RodA